MQYLIILILISQFVNTKYQYDTLDSYYNFLYKVYNNDMKYLIRNTIYKEDFNNYYLNVLDTVKTYRKNLTWLFDNYDINEFIGDEIYNIHPDFLTNYTKNISKNALFFKYNKYIGKRTKYYIGL